MRKYVFSMVIIFSIAIIISALGREANYEPKNADIQNQDIETFEETKTESQSKNIDINKNLNKEIVACNEKNSKLNYHERVWTGVPETFRNNDILKEQLRIKIEEAKAKADELDKKYNELVGNQTTYPISGEVIYENKDENYIVIYGRTNLFDRDRELIVYNYSGRFFSEYFGVGLYVGTTNDGTEIYDEGSDEIKEARKKANSASAKELELRFKLDTFDQDHRYWLDYDYAMRYSDAKNIYYNEGSMYTFLYDKDAKLKARESGRGSYDDHYITSYYTTKINKESSYEIDIDEYYIGDDKESLEYFYDKKIYEKVNGSDNYSYRKQEEFIDEDNGIIDAYLVDFKFPVVIEQSYHLFLFIGNNKVLEFSIYDKESLEHLLEIVRTIVVFPVENKITCPYCDWVFSMNNTSCSSCGHDLEYDIMEYIEEQKVESSPANLDVKIKVSCNTKDLIDTSYGYYKVEIISGEIENAAKYRIIERSGLVKAYLTDIVEIGTEAYGSYDEDKKAKVEIYDEDENLLHIIPDVEVEVID